MNHATGRPARFLRGILLVLLAAAGAACTLLPAHKPASRTTYLLRPDPLPSGASSRTCNAGTATLLVNVPREEPGFDTPRMAYLLRPNVVSYYADSQWADTPARMLASLAAQAVESTGCWRAVILAPSTIPADVRLDMEDLVLEQEFLSAPSRVRLAARAALVDMENRTVIAARRFEVVEVAPGEDANGGATAAHRAAGKFLGALAEWVEGNRPPGPPAAPPARP